MLLYKKNLKDNFSKLEKLLKTSKDTFNEKLFTDNFLDILIEYSGKIKSILENKWENKWHINEILEKNINKNIKRAINLIVLNSVGSEKPLGYSIFLPWNLDNKLGPNWKKFNLKTIDKYKEFLQVYNKLFIGNNNVKIDTFIEELNKKQMRNIPYNIIYFYWEWFSRTFLISDEVWQATFAYNWIIEWKYLKTIKKSGEVNQETPLKIVYWKNYGNKIKEILSKDFEFSIKENKDWLTDNEILSLEEDEYNTLFYKTLLCSNIYKDWKKIKADLKTIWMTDFVSLSFWRDTRFSGLSWSTLLKKNWWRNNISLKQILTFWWIDRLDLWSEKIDYSNPDHIKEILWSIRNKDWKKIEIDLRAILVWFFSELYFWYNTKFWEVNWSSLLSKNWQHDNVSLKKILSFIWIDRPDLKSENINYDNIEHIKEIFWSITDKNWKKIETDLRTIWVWRFSKLYFWYNTKFWQSGWSTLLRGNWWLNSIALKKILSFIWIDRPDLVSEKIDYSNPDHIKEILWSITNKAWNKIDTNFSIKLITNFNKLYFWYNTKFWKISWSALLKNFWPRNQEWLKKMLDFWWINTSNL